MDASIKYTETANELIIQIKPKPKGIVIFGYWFFYFFMLLILLCLGTYVLGVEFNRILRLDIDILIIIGFMITFIIIIFIYLKRLYQKEIITITKDSIELSNFFIFKKVRQIFKREEILDLKYFGGDNFTPNSLKTSNFDYLGIDSTEKEVQFIIESGKLSFSSNGSLIKFGKDIYEEDAIEIINKINKYWRSK